MMQAVRARGRIEDAMQWAWQGGAAVSTTTREAKQHISLPSMSAKHMSKQHQSSMSPKHHQYTGQAGRSPQGHLASATDLGQTRPQQPRRVHEREEGEHQHGRPH